MERKLKSRMLFVALFSGLTSVVPPASASSTAPSVEDAYQRGDRGDLNGAISELSDYLRTHRNDAMPLALRARLFYQSGKFGDALRDINEAIVLKPDRDDLYVRRGLIRERLDQKSAAIVDYSSAIRKNGANAEAYEYRGTLIYFTGAWDRSIRDFDKSIELDPSRYGSYFWRALIYLNKKEFNRAKQDVEIAARINPHFSRTHSLHAMTLIGLKDFEGAIAAASEGLKLSTPIAEHYNARAVAKLALRDWDGALEDTESALRIEPDNVEAKENLRSLRIAHN